MFPNSREEFIENSNSALKGPVVLKSEKKVPHPIHFHTVPKLELHTQLIKK